MKHVRLISRFNEELATLSREVETSVAAGLLDINKVCEDLFCGLFKELYGFENLRNLNEEEKQNFPGIDLADDVAKVAIQVSSDRTLEKIKDTLSKVIKYELHKKYDRIIVYVLTRKQGSYSAKSIKAISNGKIDFDTSSDIIDFTDFATVGANASPKKLNAALNILGAYMRGCDVGLADEDFDPPIEPPEALSTNLLEFYFPQTLYIAELLPEVLGRKRGRNQRKALGAYVREKERHIPSDYEVNNGKLISFHNLEESGNPFDFLIDVGTAEPFLPSDYYGVDVDHERVFKSLLRFSLQQKLYRHRVNWRHQEKIFVFLPIEDTDNTRKIQWIGQKRATRTVFDRKFKQNEPEKVFSMRHFAFSVSFMHVNGNWCLSITPDWYFSYGDMYWSSAYGDKLISGKKRMETNRSVHDHFRFLCSWLSDLDSEDLFSENARSSPQITFGQALGAGGGRYLNDELWEPLVAQDEDDSDQVRLKLL